MQLTKELYSAVVKNGSAVVAITGAGGKTTLLKKFSTYLPQKYKEIFYKIDTIYKRDSN